MIIKPKIFSDKRGYFFEYWNKKEFSKIKIAAKYATSKGLYTAAGHGLNEENLLKLIKIPEIIEYNIGHSIISNSIFYGLDVSIKRIQDIMNIDD